MKNWNETLKASGKTQVELSTTTTGNRKERIPPCGKDRALLKELYERSEELPLARNCLGLGEALELAILPFPAALVGSIFISEIFFTFFSWTCLDKEIRNHNHEIKYDSFGIEHHPDQELSTSMTEARWVMQKRNIFIY